MSGIQRYSITLPAELAELVEKKVQSGAYATVNDVVRDGVRALLDHDEAIDRWLRDEVVAGHAEYMAEPSAGVPADKSLRASRPRTSTDSK
jgi:putative addiction module CopG family antidote